MAGSARHVTRTRCLFIAACLFSAAAAADWDIYEKEYPGFKLWLDCRHHGAVTFYYELSKDTGNTPRKGAKFRLDPTVPDECQPDSPRSYRTPTVDPDSGTWDRGHLVPANHMDQSRDSLEATFFVTNILPQASRFNQNKGAWQQTEIISECYRDITPLRIWGGVIWGEDARNDFFVQTHGIATPDYWWKLIARTDTGEYVAWLMPNHQSATVSRMEDYLISITDLKAVLEYAPDFGAIEDSPKAETTPEASWPIEKSGGRLVCHGHATDVQ